MSGTGEITGSLHDAALRICAVVRQVSPRATDAEILPVMAIALGMFVGDVHFPFGNGAAHALAPRLGKLVAGGCGLATAARMNREFENCVGSA